MNNAAPVAGKDGQRFEAAGSWLIRFHEDTLTDAEIGEWVEWCENDPKNLQAFEELQSLWRSAAEHPPQTSVPSKRARARPRLWWPLAACIAVIAVGAGFLMTSRIALSPRQIGAGELVRTPVATNEEGILPDGSRIEVGARSLVDVNFSGIRRELELRDGEAFFQVKHERTRPFVVKAGALEVVAVGTAFNVRRTGAQVVVTVQEGSVEVRRRDGGGFAEESARAHAGQQLSFQSGSGELHDAMVDPAVTLAWRSGRLEFTGDSLDVVVANVNRYSRRPVILADTQLGALKFTGTVFFANVDAWLDGLEQVFPIDVHRNDPQGIVLTKR